MQGQEDVGEEVDLGRWLVLRLGLVDLMMEWNEMKWYGFGCMKQKAHAHILDE